jgi:hypothetical protein
MKALRAFLIPLLIGSMVAQAADAPLSALDSMPVTPPSALDAGTAPVTAPVIQQAPATPNTPAAASCKVNLGNLARAVPPPSEKPATLRNVQKTLGQIIAAVKSGQTQQLSGQILSRPKWPSQPQAAKPVEDGVIWHFEDTGEGHNGKNYSPSDYRKLTQMLTDASKVLDPTIGKTETGRRSGYETPTEPQNDNQSPVSFFQIDDPDQIRKFLETSGRVESLNELNKLREERNAKHMEAVAKHDAAVRRNEDAQAKVQEEADKQKKGFALGCMVVGGGIGVLAGGGYALRRDPDKDLDQEIIDKAKKSIVMDRKTHIALLKEAWRNDPDRDRKIKDHEKQLDNLEKLGVKIDYGARFSDYLPSLGQNQRRHSSYDDDDSYYHRSNIDPLKLATGPHRPLTEETLEYEAANPKEAKEFTQGELDEKNKRAASGFVSFLTGVGEAIGAGGIGGGLAWVSCTAAGGKLFAAKPAAASLVEVPPLPPALEGGPTLWHPDGSPPPELAEFRNVVNQTFSPNYHSRTGTPNQVLVTGANTHDGLHTLLALVVDNTANPPTMKLMGLGYRSSVDYEKPPEQVKPTSPATVQEKPIDLKQLRDRLANAHFQQRYLDENRQLDRVFELANRLKAEGKLEAKDVREFKSQIDRLIGSETVTEANLKELSRFLENIRARRAR